MSIFYVLSRFIEWLVTGKSKKRELIREAEKVDLSDTYADNWVDNLNRPYRRD